MKSHALTTAAAAVIAVACATRGAPDASAARTGQGSPPPAQGSRFAPFTGASYDQATRTVELVLATGVLVKRSWYSEELDMSPSAVDLGRVPLNQCRLLFNHDFDDPIGVIESTRFENGALIARARFNDTLRGQEIGGMVSRGELTGVSIGYAVKTWTLVEITGDGFETWRATAWELLEGSIVTVPADPHAGVRSVMREIHPSEPGASADPQEESEMNIRSAPGGASASSDTQAAPAAPAGSDVRGAPAPDVITPPAAPPAAQARGLSAVELLTAQAAARAVGVELADADLTRSAIDPVADVNALILQRAAERQAGNTVAAGSAARAGEVDAGQRTAVEGVLLARMTGGRMDAAFGELRGYRVAELIGLRMGLRTRDPQEILGRAMHTSSDFPLLLEAAANKALLTAYAAAQPTYRSWAAKRRFTDFKPHKFLRIGEFPTLVALGEGGEVKGGTITESRETVSATTKGRFINLSRQMIVNDDLGAFGDLVTAAGRAAARTENRAAYALLAANGALSDSVAMFHATHGNLAGAGTVIDIANVGKARAAMRKQTNLAKDEILNLTPKILLVGPDKETEAQQFVAPVNAQQNGNVNPFSGKLEVVADAEITGNVWRLFADPSDAPNFIYGYVGDAEGPMISQDKPFGVDGMGLQVLHDFGVGSIDFRGGYQNPGA